MAEGVAEVKIIQAAFRSSRTRAVIRRGRFRDIMLLPGGLDADLGEWQAGLIDTTGRFVDRREAAAVVGHAGRLESRSYFGGDREPTLEAGHSESFRCAAWASRGAEREPVSFQAAAWSKMMEPHGRRRHDVDHVLLSAQWWRTHGGNPA